MKTIMSLMIKICLSKKMKNLSNRKLTRTLKTFQLALGLIFEGQMKANKIKMMA